MSKYRLLDVEDLNELCTKRDALADEAAAALDVVLMEHGIDPVVLARFSNTTAVQREPTQAEMNEALVNSKLAISCKAIFVITFWSTIELALTKVTFNPVVILGSWLLVAFASYKLASTIIRSIATATDASSRQKRKNIWILILCVFVVYFFVFASIATVPSRI